MFTKHNWIESSYNEDSSEEMIYYVADNCKAGDLAYLYMPGQDELSQLRILKTLRRSEDIEYYDSLPEDILIDGEDKFGADTSAEFIYDDDCILVWFEDVITDCGELLNYYFCDSQDWLDEKWEDKSHISIYLNAIDEKREINEADHSLNIYDLLGFTLPTKDFEHFCRVADSLDLCIYDIGDDLGDTNVKNLLALFMFCSFSRIDVDNGKITEDWMIFEKNTDISNIGAWFERTFLAADNCKEKLKAELFMEGIDFIEELFKIELNPDWEKDTIDNYLDEIINSMSNEELEEIYNKIGIAKLSFKSEMQDFIKTFFFDKSIEDGTDEEYVYQTLLDIGADVHFIESVIGSEEASHMEVFLKDHGMA